MKNTTLSLTLLALFAVWQSALAQENNLEAYAVLDANGTLTFYYDENKSDASAPGTVVYDVPWNSGDPEDYPEPGWVAIDENWEYIDNTDINFVCFDESFSEYRLESAYDMFAACTALTSIDFTNFNTSSITNMSGMFYNCSGLSALDLSSFDTENVEVMSVMFSGCSALTSLNLSNFNTKNVIDMWGMFTGCSGLTSLEQCFNTDNVWDMTDMFAGCSALTSLDLSNFNTENVTYMWTMFDGCSSLQTLVLTNFNTANVVNMKGMFSKCYSLTTIYCNDDWSSIVRVDDFSSYGMFSGCMSLPNYSVFNDNDITYAKPSTMGGYFTKYGPLAYAVLTNDRILTFYYDENFADKAEDSRTVKVFYDFNWGEAVPEWQNKYNDITIVMFDASFINYPIASTASMFLGLNKLTSIIDLEYLNTSNVTDMSSMFEDCNVLRILDLSNFNTENVTDMSSMFKNCYALLSLDLSNFDTGNVTDMSYMFCWCSIQEGLDLSSFKTENVIDMSSMFQHFSGRSILNLSNFDTGNVTNMSSMFGACNFESLDLSSFNTENVKDMSFMFMDCVEMTSLDLSSFNTAKVSTMEGMFENCNKLTSLDLTSFSVPADKDLRLRFMFWVCTNLETIFCNSDFNNGHIGSDNGNYLFSDCVSLKGVIDYNLSNTNYTFANPTTGYFTYGLRDYADNNSLIENTTNVPRVGLVGRTLYRDGDWNSLCLPFSLTAEQLATSPLAGFSELRTLSKTEYDETTSTLTLNFTPTEGEGTITSIEAGKPYIIKWAEQSTDIVEPIFTDVTFQNVTESGRTVSTDYVDFIGNFNPISIGDEGDNTKLYLGGGNGLYYPNGASTFYGFRAYFQLKEGLTAGPGPSTGSSQVKAINLNFGEEENGIQEITTDSNTSSTYFTLDGRCLTDKPATSGIYIHNGKKVMIK